MLDSRVIYQLHNSNLGDHWTSYCLMTCLGKRHKRQYSLGVRNAGEDYTKRLEEVAGLFREQLYSPILVDAEGQEKVDAWLNWAYPAVLVDFRHRWDISHVEKTVCYQFDGISSAEDKNPPPMLALGIKGYFKNKGFKLIRLGGHMSLEEAVFYLSRCSLFVGCDSGFSHIAHSVGCPVYMYEGNLPFWHVHRLKQMDIFKNIQELDMRVEKWLQLLDL